MKPGDRAWHPARGECVIVDIFGSTAKVRLPGGASWHLPVDELWPLDDDESLAVMCRTCRRTSPVTPGMLSRLFDTDAIRRTPLIQAFERLGHRLRCSACGGRGAVLVKTVAISAPTVTLTKRSAPDTFLFDLDPPSWEDAAFGLDDEADEGDEALSEYAYYDEDRDEWVEPGDDDVEDEQD